MVKRWVPNKILEVQGYYQGATQIWLPKTKSTVKSPQFSLPQNFCDLQPKETLNSDHQAELIKLTNKTTQDTPVATLTTTQLGHVTELRFSKSYLTHGLWMTKLAPALLRIPKKFYVPQDPP